MSKAQEIYRHHGLVLSPTRTSQMRAECPFCMKEKFYVHKETGVFDCKVCRASGNVITFLRQLWRKSLEATTSKDYDELAKSRGPFQKQFESWGVCRSVLGGGWIMPQSKVPEKISNLCTKSYEETSYAMFSTPTMQVGLFGLPKWNKSYVRSIICEGPWDGIAAQAAVDSLGWHMNVVAVPGCLSWNSSWNELFNGQDVTIIYDNDHDRVLESGKTVYSSGTLGQKKVAKTLFKVAKSVRVANWNGKLSWNKDIPDKTDLRDILTGKVAV